MTENLPAPAPDDSGEFILYQTEDGHTRIEVRMADGAFTDSQNNVSTAKSYSFTVTGPEATLREPAPNSSLNVAELNSLGYIEVFFSTADGAALDAPTIGSCDLTAGGACVVSADLTTGTHDLVARFAGTTEFAPSVSAAAAFRVTDTTTTVVTGSSPNPSTYGELVTVTVAVASASGIPTGSVSLSDGSTTVGTCSLTSGGSCTVQPSAIWRTGPRPRWAPCLVPHSSACRQYPLPRGE